MPKAETGDAKRKDTGKIKFALIPPYPLWELARLYTIGAEKYADNGWVNNPSEWSRALSAMQRHLNAWEQGEVYDPVDGQHHLAAVAWGAFTLMQYQKDGLGEDDRAFVDPAFREHQEQTP